MADPVTLANAARYVYLAWSSFTGGGLNRQQRAAVDAARGAGYSIGVRGYRDPQGRVVSQRDVILAGGTILGTPTPTVPPPTTAPPGNFPVPQPQPQPNLPDRGRDLKRRQPNPRGPRVTPRKEPRPNIPRRPATPPSSPWEPPPQSRRFPGRIINPNLPYEVAARSVPLVWRIIGAAAGLLYPTPTSATDTILGRPPGSQRGPARRPRIRPRPDEPPQPIPQPPAAPIPRPAPQPPPVSVPLEVPQIWQRPIPTPTPVPAPAPTATSTPAGAPFNPLLLAPLALLFPTPGGRPSRLTDPLTPSNPLTPTPTPRPGAPPRVPPPKVPTPTLTPFQPPGVGSQPNRGNRCKPCRCKQPKKRKRKKREPRNVCYSGTFTETRTSTRKLRKRKIKCQ